MSEKTVRQPLSAEDRQFNKNKWIFSVTGVARDLAYNLVAVFLLTYIQFSVSLTAIQFTTLYIFIAIGGKIWDAINDPFMGALIESTHMKFGKFKPWILFGAVGCGIVIMLMFSIRLEGWAFVGFMAIIYLLWESTFTMNDIGYWAMLPSLSSETKKRNNVTMLTVLFAGIGAIIAQGVIPIFTTANMVQGYLVVGLLIGTIYIVANALCAIFIKETPREKLDDGEKITIKKMLSIIKSNDQILWMTLSMLFYNIGSMLLIALAANLVYFELGYNGTYYFYLVVAYGVTSVLGNIFYPKIAAKLGRRKMQFLAVILACVGYAVIAVLGWTQFLPFNIFVVCGFVVLVSLGQSWFYMASIVNMTNCVEYNEYKNGERNEAVISTLRPFMAKFADALKYGIVIVALMASGIYTMSQSISALETQKSMFESKSTVAAQQHYIETVRDYYIEISATLDSQLEALYKRINDEIAADSTLATWQLKAEDIVVIAEVTVFKTEKDASGKVKRDSSGNAIIAETFVLKDATTFSTTNGNYEFELTEAADKAFRDKAKDNVGSRLILRVTITIVPIVFLLGALVVQRKKFKIDEEFYDKIVAEIEQRHSESN